MEGASVTGYFAERSELKELGYDVEIGIDDDGPAMQVTKVIDLEKLSDLEKEMQK